MNSSTLPFVVLGDKYVKSEFKLHKTAKDQQLQQFTSEWQAYLSHLRETKRAQTLTQSGITGERGKDMVSPPLNKFGVDMEANVQMNEEQKAQLMKLREETLKALK